MKSKNKTYDVVILTHAPTNELLISIEKLTNQSIKPINIYIYNTDETLFYKNISDKQKLKRYIADKVIKVTHITENAFDHGRTRNKAAKECKSNYILFLTDDAVPYDDFLAANLLKAFEKNKVVCDSAYLRSNVAVAYARQIPKSNASLKERIVREFNYPDYDIVKEKSKEASYGIKNYFCSNVCAMYDSEIFKKLGRFEEDIILNEDTFFVYNAINSGFKVVYKSNAKVYHSHNLNNKQQFSRNFDIGVSQKEHREIFDSIPTEKEGTKLLKYAVNRMIKMFKFKEAFDFIIECTYRYYGFKTGYNYEKLTKEQCIKYACNKKYFKK